MTNTTITAAQLAAMRLAQDQAAAQFWAYPDAEWQAAFQAEWLMANLGVSCARDEEGRTWGRPCYGATYSTDPDNFGEITHVFEVDPDWQGYRFHGYCKPTQEEVEAFFA
jgi:hypothetical protein